MRAVRSSDGSVTVADVELGHGDGVRVKVTTAGICGSDLSIVAGGMVPFTLGHEIAGVLDDGTRVAIEPLAPCGTCDQCGKGAYNRCRSSSLLFGVGRDGGMADYVLAPERTLVPLPDRAPAGAGCLVEPIAVSLHGVRQARTVASDRVLVIGGGTIGLTAVAAAKSVGATVDLVARHPHQAAAGQSLGARVGEPDGEYDVVIDCAGNEATITQAVETCAPGGTIVVLAAHHRTMPVNGLAVMLKEVSLIGSLCYGWSPPGTKQARDFESAAALLAEEPAIATTLITHRFPLDRAVDAFAAAADRKSGSIKVVLEP
ncbi:MAG: zinc-binding dehydrogenase [Acidimicrobiia bacterium]